MQLDTRCKNSNKWYVGKQKHGYNGNMIQNRLRVLVAEKSHRERRKITLRDLAKETDIPQSVLIKYNSQSVRRYDTETLNKLCQYFGVKDIGELLEYVEDTKTSRK